MLDYPTCLKLKEAGFPQDLKKGDWYHFTKRKGQWLVDSELRADSLKGMTLKVPSLEELIEACPKLYNGQVFDLCYLPNGVWTAWYEAPNEEIRPSKEGLGKTPIEAVANLWLALAKSN